MLRKYIIINKLTGHPCYNGRRFFSLNGAFRAAHRLRMIDLEFLEIQKLE